MIDVIGFPFRSTFQVSLTNMDSPSIFLSGSVVDLCSHVSQVHCQGATSFGCLACREDGRSSSSFSASCLKDFVAHCDNFHPGTGYKSYWRHEGENGERWHFYDVLYRSLQVVESGGDVEETKTIEENATRKVICLRNALHASFVA